MIGLIGGLAGSAACAIATVGQPHNGPLVTAGPVSATRPGDQAIASWMSVDSPELDALLRATRTEWSAVILRSSPAAGLELSTNTAVMAIAGFPGNDPVPTLHQFQDYVAQHRITYYIVPNTVGGLGPRGFASQQHVDITGWVETHFPPTKAGRTVVYGLIAPTKL
jgi:hypothetical protein